MLHPSRPAVSSGILTMVLNICKEQVLSCWWSIERTGKFREVKENSPTADMRVNALDSCKGEEDPV
jgi:hypothetical protein